MRLYFNPDCSKSRAALALLTEAGYRPTVSDYIRRPLDRATLERLVAKLDTAPAALLRPNDDASVHELGTAGIIEILLAAPERLQRPVLETDDRALIARPPERVFELIKRNTSEAKSR